MIHTPTRIVLPLFPLPDVVLFPGVELPLHVFEPRYRQLTEDALGADRLLGMAVLKPGYEPGAPGSPAIYPLLGYGVIEAARRYADGRFLLLVRGVGRGIITSEMAMGEKLYRRAHLEVRPESEPTRALGPLVTRLRALLSQLADLELDELKAMAGKAEKDGEAPAALNFVNTVAFAAPLSPPVKLELLQLNDPVARAEALLHELESVRGFRTALIRHRPRADARGETSGVGSGANDFSNN
jgi:uncharacterized protein